MSIFMDDTQPATLVLTRASSSASYGEVVTSGRSTKVKHSLKLTPSLLQTVLTLALGSGLMYGYNFALLNNCESVVKNHVNESVYIHYGSYFDSHSMEVFWTCLVLALPIGAVLGCLSSNFCSHKLGRRQILAANNVIGIIGATMQLISSMTHYVELLAVGRLITGVYCGLIATIAPVYLNEIAPVSQRGYVTSTFQLSNVVGTTIALFLGLTQVLGVESRFHYLFIISLIMPFVQNVMLKFCPESPRFLLLFKSDAFAAMQSLRRLRDCPDVSEDLAEIDNEILHNSEDAINQNRARSMLRLTQILSKPSLRKMLLICICLHASQALVGVSIMLSYSKSILSEVFGSQFTSLFWDAVIYSFLIPFTLVATALIEKTGRRSLHIIGIVGTLFGSLLVTTALLDDSLRTMLKDTMLLGGLIVFLCSYAVGPGPIPWLMVPELVPSSARSSISSLSVVSNIVISSAIITCYPLLKSAIGPKVFILFMTASCCTGLFLFFTLPETKQKTSDEILLSVTEELVKFPVCCEQKCIRGARKRNELDQDNELFPNDSDPLF